MVNESRINLIDEFVKHQKDNDVILLTTYNFDPPFFDIYIFKNLVYRNPLADIFVLMDGYEYNRIYSLFTKHTGRGYNLIPIYAKRGVFHPKVFLFFSEENNKISLYVGSPNITLSGFTSNAEIVTKMISDLKPISSSSFKLIGFFEKLVNKNYVRNKKFSLAIQYMKNNIGDISIDDNVEIFTNLEKAILPNVMNFIDKPKEVFLLAPFWSPNTKVLENIYQNGSIEKINIAVQDKNHNLDKPELYIDFFNKNKISFNFFNARFDKNRRFHSKIIAFRGVNDYLFVGSSNLTEFALLHPCDIGNFEVSLLLKNNPDDILKDINLEHIKDVKKISKNSIILPEEEKPKTIDVYNVDFDIIQSILHIEMECSKDETEVNILFEDGEIDSFKIKNQDIIEKYCEKVPFEVFFKRNEAITKRRVFYDSNYFYKRIRRGSVNLNEIGKKVLSDFNISAGDLLRIIYSINSSIIEEEKIFNKKFGIDGKVKKKKFFGPSREAVEVNRSILNRLGEIYRFIAGMKNLERERQESGEIEKKDVRVPGYLKKIYDNIDERKKLCFRLLDTINDILLYKVQKNGNKPDDILSTMGLFAQSITKIVFPIYMDFDLLDDFSKKLDNNLKDIQNVLLDTELKKSFFMNLVFTNYVCRISQRYFCVGYLFDVEEVVNPGFFDECKYYIKNQMEKMHLNRDIDFNEIGYYSGNVASYFSNNKTILDDILKVIKKANLFVKDDQLEFFKSYLESLRRWSISPIIDDIRNIAEKLNTKQKKIVLNFLDKSY